MPAKDLLHPPGGRLVDLDGRRQTSLSRNTPIAVGDSPVDRFPLPEPKQLASPVALGDFRTLILGDDALNLDQQLGMGIRRRWTLQEMHRDTQPIQFLD